MSRPTKYQKQVIAPRFARWASALLNEPLANEGDTASSNARNRLALELARIHERTATPEDNLIRRKDNAGRLSGKIAPQAFTVAEYGEAFRRLGVSWCSIPVALFASGYLEDFCAIIALLTIKYDTALATRLAVAIPRAVYDGHPYQNQARALAALSDNENDEINDIFAFWISTGQKKRQHALDSAPITLGTWAISAARHPTLTFNAKARYIEHCFDLWLQEFGVASPEITNLAGSSFVASSYDGTASSQDYFIHVLQNQKRLEA